MTTAILKAIRDKILVTTAITTLLGGNYVYTAEIMQTNQYPSITLRLSTEGSKKRVGYNAIKKRDNTPILQADIWSKSSRYQTYKIADALDALLMPDAVANTRCWLKIGDGDQYEIDTGVYHKAMRYSFDYTITDT